VAGAPHRHHHGTAGELARILDADPQKVGPDEIALATGTTRAGSSRPRFAPATTNPTGHRYKHNVIPDAEALIDIRTLPGEEDAVLAELAELVGPDIEIAVLH
jgi:acetylornithine deacetylase/succinyl-diaminopimelate desuccinylase-like protein